MEFLCADSLPELEQKVTAALSANKLLHGEWKILPNGSFAQAVCPAAWRPMPEPPGADSNLLVPRPGAGRLIQE